MPRCAEIAEARPVKLGPSMNPVLRRILVPLDGSPYTAAGTRVALDIARRHGAEVTGLAVLDSPGLRAEVSPAECMHWPLVQDAVRERRRGVEAELARAEETFREACAAAGVPHRQLALEGTPAHKILEVALLFDLLVIGLRTFYRLPEPDAAAEAEADAGGDSLSKLLDRTSTPVVAVPEQAPERLERVLAAYDGSFGAARTLRDFIPFALPFGPRITVLSAHPEPGRAECLAAQAADFLRAHGFADVETHPSQDEIFRAVSKLLPETDLVVAGIHTRRVAGVEGPGSFTQRLIDADEVALFLSH
jgi:nucleotide-binding universal stress UspA family protein